MSQVVPSQHPAVVLRSQYLHLRALLIAALIAAATLTAAVVILATNDESGTATAPTSQERRWAAYDEAIRALTPGQRAALLRGDSVAPRTRYDGGPEEGTADVTPTPPRPTDEQTFPGLARQFRNFRR